MIQPRLRYGLSALLALSATVLVFIATATQDNPVYDRSRLEEVAEMLAEEVDRPVTAKLAAGGGQLVLSVTYIPAPEIYESEAACLRQMDLLMEAAVIRYRGFVHGVSVRARPPGDMLLVGGLPPERTASQTVAEMLRRFDRELILEYGDSHWPITVSSYHEWKSIMIHHSGGIRGSAESFEEWHRKGRGWEGGLGYQFVIGNGNGAGDGQVQAGRRWTGQVEGAHAGVERYNQESVGLCLVGDFSTDEELARAKQPRKHEAGPGRPTRRQMASLHNLTLYLCLKLDIPVESIFRHRDVRHTICPGENFPIKQLVADVRHDLVRLKQFRR